MTEQLCESCQEPFEIVENIVIYGDEIYHNKCWTDYCKRDCETKDRDCLT